MHRWQQPRASNDLQQGDCFSLAGQFPVDRFSVVDCDDPHQYEIYAVFSNPSPPGVPYPGMEAQAKYAGPPCIDAFERYTSLEYSTRIGTLLIQMLMPEEPFWDQGIRTIACALHRRDMAPMVGSAYGGG